MGSNEGWSDVSSARNNGGAARWIDTRQGKQYNEPLMGMKVETAAS
jgi:hypothetical protein